MSLVDRFRFANLFGRRSDPEALRATEAFVAETYSLLGSLREPTLQERATLSAKGFIFLPVSALSLLQFSEENRDYFGYITPSKDLKFYTPPGDFMVAINTQLLCLPGSNNITYAEQLTRIKEYSKLEIEPELPGARAVMLPATVLAQLDIQFQKRNDGEKLFPDFWVQALDKVFGPYAACVGRFRPGRPLSVDYRYRDCGYELIYAMPAVVFVSE